MGSRKDSLPKERRAALKQRGWLVENWVEGKTETGENGSVGSFRKEVIQPQVLLQLPCYDFTPITDHTVGACPPYGLARRLLVQPAFVM